MFFLMMGGGMVFSKIICHVMNPFVPLDMKLFWAVQSRSQLYFMSQLLERLTRMSECTKVSAVELSVIILLFYLVDVTFQCKVSLIPIAVVQL